LILSTLAFISLSAAKINNGDKILDKDEKNKENGK
jgi:hypothetical protein